MAEATLPQGKSGDGDGAPVVAGDAPEPEKTYTQQQIEGMIAARLRNAKKEQAALQARIAELERKRTVPDPDDEPLTAGAPAPTADDKSKWERRLKRKAAEWEVERQELLAKHDAAIRAHDSTRIQHALLSDLSRRGTVRDVAAVLQLTASEFEVAEGAVVPRGEDAESVAAYFDKWLRDHPVFVAAPAAGSGDRTGRVAAQAAKKVGDMTEAEAHREATKALFGAKR